RRRHTRFSRDWSSDVCSSDLDAQSSAYVLSDGENELNIDLTLSTDTGVTITKRYHLARDSYEIGVRYLIQNNSDSDWQGNFTGKIGRASWREGAETKVSGVQI